MTNLNADLQNYLTRNESNQEKKGFSFFSGSQSPMKNWFSNSNVVDGVGNPESNREENNNANRWFSGEDSMIPALGKKQRVMGFVFCIIMGLFCFTLAGLYFPMLLIKTRKFAMLYTLGSVFFLFSFSVLWGPMNHLKHLCSKDRLLFTISYIGTMFATLYFALWAKSTLLTGIFALAQVLALIWYLTSYIPGGTTGMRFFGKVFSSTVTRTAGKTLPV